MPRLALAATDESVLRNSIPEVEQALGYRFGNRRLLLTALTHRSFCNETDTATGDFDELEWLGDSVLQLAISSWLFRSAEGSRRSSGQLSATRQRFVDSHACESFARKLNLLPFLRIGHGQPVRGTKILADCFEAVLGAVYVDAGGCSDLEPIHAILARAIPSYEHGRRSQEQPRRRHPHPNLHHLHHRFDRSWARDTTEPPPRPPAEEPRKLMNLAHRLSQMAKGSTDGAHACDAARAGQGDGLGSPQLSPAAAVPQRGPLEVLHEFDARLRGFQQNVLRGGALSFAARAFTEEFGGDVARFFAAAATGDRSTLMDEVLDGSSMLRKHFGDAPPGAERVVMEVVPVPSELRLQTFTVAEFLMTNVLQHKGGAAEPAGDNRVLRLIRTAPHGDATIAFLLGIVTETRTNLLLNTRQRATISAGVALVPLPGPASLLTGAPHGSPMSPPPPPSPGPVFGGSPPLPGFPPPQNGHCVCVPGRKRSPPHRGGAPWGAAGPRGRGGGLGRGGGGGGRGQWRGGL